MACASLLAMPSSITAELAKRVRQLREAATWTQWQLAEAAGVTDETISRIERGMYEPAMSTLVAVAGALGVSIGTLLGETGSPRRIEYKENAILRRLVMRVEMLSPKAQRILLQLADLLPETAGGQPAMALHGRSPDYAPGKRSRRKQ